MTKTSKTVARGAVIKSVPKAKVESKKDQGQPRRKIKVGDDGHLDVDPAPAQTNTARRYIPADVQTGAVAAELARGDGAKAPPVKAVEPVADTKPGPQPSGSGFRPEGKTVGSVSAQWASRPDDERFVSLADLHKTTKGWAESSTVVKLSARDIDVEADEATNSLLISHEGKPLIPTHWSFSQLAAKASVPAEYARRIPAELAALNLGYGLSHSDDEVAFYQSQKMGNKQGALLRAITGQEYGRIYDHEVVGSLIKMTETGKVHWKVPGMIEGANGRWSHNPKIEVTKANTTIYGSDRDIFIFLCDDEHPIEIGKLPDGSPDLVFRGIIVRNSELGNCLLVIAVMYLRGVCCNRILWGVEGYEEVSIRHTKSAPEKFLLEHRPALETYANASTKLFLKGITEARKMKVATDDDEAVVFLNERAGFSQGEAKKVLELHLTEEGHPARTVWDMAQGITAHARGIPYMDKRLEVEGKARKLLDKLKVAA